MEGLLQAGSSYFYYKKRKESEGFYLCCEAESWSSSS
ncbi:hypothetical protein V6Z12_D13G138800 [Gossypium hirsutum]